MTTPVAVYDRIHIKNDKRPNLVIEYLDGYCDEREDWVDEWRLIDLDTGEVFEADPVLNEVVHAAHCITTTGKDSEYVVGWRKKDMPGKSTKNPFIILTSVEDGQHVRVNILHIITYSQVKYSNSEETFTYMTNSSPSLNVTKFKESVSEIDAMIAEYYE